MSMLAGYAVSLGYLFAGCSAIPPSGVFSCSEHADCPRGQRCDPQAQLCFERALLAANSAQAPGSKEGAAGEGSNVSPASTDGGAANMVTAPAAGGVGGSELDAAGHMAGMSAAGASTGTPMAGVSGGSSPAANDPSGLAKIGDACTAKGRGACAAIGSSQALMCDGSRWVDDGQCAADSVCGYTLGRQSRCVKIVSECRGQREGSLVCVGSLASACNEDLTNIKVVQDCVEPIETCQAGKCVCDHPCGSACPDRTTDPRHCGQCDHACAGACSNGMCEPQRLATTGPSPVALTHDANALYWTESVSGTVKKVALTGGAATTLATIQGAMKLVVGARGLYVNGELGLYSVPLEGGTATMLLDHGAGQGTYLAIDGSWLYMANPSVTKLAVTGGTPTVLAMEQFARAFVFSAGYLYWTASNGSVTKMSANGGTLTTLSSGAKDSVSEIAVDAKYVYWYDVPRSAIVRVPVAGGSISDFATNTTCNGMISDGEYLYWSNNLNPGSLFRQPVDGTTATVIARGTPYALAQDDENLYWLEANWNADGAVMKLPK
ncbi:MAG TPA: DUF5050 domain-containing protein [Polyangiales bacterium]|nr:DUF5050 domain-containing protein [Polyangiales bacterium]